MIFFCQISGSGMRAIILKKSSSSDILRLKKKILSHTTSLFYFHMQNIGKKSIIHDVLRISKMN